MKILAQKFGGSSVATPQHIKNVARKILASKKKGYKVVVVVSAMGDTTDELVDLAKQISNNPSRREMDMLLSTGEQVSIALLSMAINELGSKAISFTGAQSGIITDGVFSRARILDVDVKKINDYLKKDYVVIVAGFQGVDAENEITTLGRGGSDTSAVVLAAALKATACEIYTDVDGVYTTDPRVVKSAKKLFKISYDEMLELASLGAKVLHPRSVEVAREYKVNLVVRSSFNKKEGTAVVSTKELEKAIPVRGVACDKNVAKISIMAIPDKPGIAGMLFQTLSKEAINIDMIIQNVTRGQVNDISFTVAAADGERAHNIAQAIGKNLKAEKVLFDESLSKVSIVGAGMISKPGVAAKMFEVLGKNKINIEMISTSEIKISCLIARNKADLAVKKLHSAFITQE